jgi:uncharacterized protein YndB with AHSA1/START domain
MNRPDTVMATIRIAAAPADVFPYFVEPHLLVQWIGTWADLHPEPGGLFALDVGDTPVRGTYVLVEPPHRVVFTWGVPGSTSLPAGCSTVEILLTGDGEETVVELFHYDLPADERPRHKAGWTSFLDILRQTAGAKGPMVPPENF